MNTLKSLKIYCTRYVRSGYGKEDILQEKFLFSEIVYNADAHVEQEKHYLAENELNYRVINEYDAHGRLSKTCQYDGDGQLVEVTGFTRDERDRVLIQRHELGEMGITYETHYTYEGDKIMQQDSYDEGQFAFTEKKWLYNSENKIIKIIEYNEDAEEKYVTVFTYDSNGLVIKQVRDEVLEKDRRTCFWEYDEHGREIKRLIYDYENILIAKCYTSYNDSGLVLVLEEEDLDHYQKTTNHYQGDKLVKSEVVDGEGHALSCTEHEYDSSGNVIGVRHFYPDEVQNGELRLYQEFLHVRE
ncbi:MAG: hypothetical protein LBR51_03235 [Bacteroidales bacterium]|jgi:hypothetical protein|nr:hypothetical protein [Bacteroidales bacterium]